MQKLVIVGHYGIILLVNFSSEVVSHSAYKHLLHLNPENSCADCFWRKQALIGSFSPNPPPGVWKSIMGLILLLLIQWIRSDSTRNNMHIASILASDRKIPLPFFLSCSCLPQILQIESGLKVLGYFLQKNDKKDCVRLHNCYPETLRD